MSLSLLSPFCRLCATPGNGVELTDVNSELGRKENLDYLINKYIDTHLLLPKNDRLCVCDTCKTRLMTWNSFIVSCQEAQEKIKCAFIKSTNEINQCKVGLTNETERQNASGSSLKMKRSSNYCIARWCNKGNYRGVSLFRLPKDRNRALKWLSGAERPDLKNKPNLHSYYVCANHFTPNMFTNKARNQLIRKAEPTLFPRLSLSNKIDKERASLFHPTQFQGVQLKNILPKSSLGSLPSCSKTLNGCKSTFLGNSGKGKELDVKILEQIPPKETLTIGSNVGLEGISSKFTPIQNVLYIVNSAPISCMPLNESSTILSGNQVSPCVTAITNGEDESTENILLSGSLKFNLLANVDDKPSDGESASLDKVTCFPRLESNEISFMSNDSSETHAELSNILEKGQKSFLDDLGSCLASDAFSSTSLLNVNDSFQDSFTFREPKPGSPYKSHSKPEISEHTQPNENHEPSSVGSQDFLLPHVPEMADKQSNHFSEQTFPLKSEVTPETACVASLKVSRDHNLILNHAIESKSPTTGLFDLQADDNHSSYISGVDEFLDLDRYF